MKTIQQFTIVLGTLIYPVYALPWIIKLMLKNQHIGYFLLSLFMGYLSYLMIPYDTMDITRYYEIFDSLSSSSIDKVFSSERSFEYTFNLYMWCVSYIGLNKEFIPFSVSFLTYYLYFISLKKVMAPFFHPNTGLFISHKLLMVIGVFLLFNEIRFISTASGLRNNLSFAIFTFAIIDFSLYRNKIKNALLAILATMLHVAVLPLLIIFLFSLFISNRRTIRRTIKLLFTISLLLIITGMNEFVFYKLIDFLKPFLQANGLFFHAYMDPNGAWGSAFYDDKNIKTIIYEKFIKPLPFYLAGLYLFFERELALNRLQNYLFMAFIFIALISISRTLLDRYSYFFVLLFIFVFLIELQSKKFTSIKKIFTILMVSALLLVDIGGLVKYRDTYAKSWGKILYIPAPFMFTNKVLKNEYIKRRSL